MWRRTASYLCAAAASAATTTTPGAPAQENWKMRDDVVQYLQHLQPQDGTHKDLVPLFDLLPTEKDGVEKAYEFQKLCIEEVHKMDDPTVIWKAYAPGSDAVKFYKGVSDTLVSPIFRSMVAENGTQLSIRQLPQCYHIEMGLILRMESGSATLAGVTPAIEFIGSRWAYCSPHLPGFLADMSGHCGLIRGTEVQTNRLPVLGGVLTRENEPLLVGYLKDRLQYSTSLDQLLALVKKHHVSGFPDPTNQLWESQGYMEIYVGGLGGRVPAKAGNYEATFGPLGRVSTRLDG